MTKEKALERLGFVWVPSTTKPAPQIPDHHATMAFVLNPHLQGEFRAINLADQVQFYQKPLTEKPSDATPVKVQYWATRFECASLQAVSLLFALRRLDASGELGRNGHPHNNPTYIEFAKTIVEIIEIGTLLVGVAHIAGADSSLIADLVGNPLRIGGDVTPAVAEAKRVSVHFSARHGIPVPALASSVASATTADIVGLERATEPFDKGNGLWVRNKVAAKLESVETRTLAAYRQSGIANQNGTFGRDAWGRIWRREGNPSSHPWYLKSSLVSQNRI